jgi:hypothetical protein
MSYSANDNQNFFVQSGRTTSRVLHTPGGECSISLGGYTPEELERMRQRREQGKSAPKSEESTSIVVAKENSSNTNVVEESKEDSKQLDSIAEHEQANPSNEEDHSKEADTNEQAVAVTSGTTTESTMQSQPDTVVKKGVSSNAFASASTTNSFNVLTDRPTSRVTNPPGGKDNLWF